MKFTMRKVRFAALAMFLVASVGAGAAASADDEANCCYPGSVVYYDNAGTVVGVRMYGCGDPGWGIVTTRSRTFNGCVM